jgi:hypothetical protein
MASHLVSPAAKRLRPRVTHSALQRTNMLRRAQFSRPPVSRAELCGERSLTEVFSSSRAP